MTYPEKSWIFLKHSKKLFAKKQKNGGCLKVWLAKKNVQIWPNRMFSYWKRTQIKKCQEKKAYFFSQDIIKERKFEIKATKIFGQKKGLFFGAPLFRQLKSNWFDFFYKMLILWQNIYFLKKLASSLLY